MKLLKNGEGKIGISLGGDVVVVLDEKGNQIKSVDDLLREFSNSKIEQGVTERFLVKNQDGTVSWEERQVVRVSIRR